MNPLTYIDPDDPYPDSDGLPMAESTLQYDWIVKLKENLEILFADRPEVFVAGNLFWYAEPDRHIVGPAAPDAMVAFGRPKGPRGSYKQWEEDGIAPQVTFEVRSPSNSAKDMRDKLEFYDTYGVEEYYVYDPERIRLEVWLRRNGRLEAMSHLHGWTSPRLGIRFALRPDTLEVFYPDGRSFLSPVELARQAEEADVRAREAAARAEEADVRAREAAARAEEADVRAREAVAQVEEAAAWAREATSAAERERARAERLAERLRALGLDPEGP